jgi:phosphatidylglycerol---prolipoprotein diacylglyceryl transferase
MSILSFIIWEAMPELFTFPDSLPLLGGRPVRYYGLLFALGFLISQQILFFIYRKEGKPEKDVETLTIFMVIATVIGARLGHVLFYEPDKYLSDPIEILKIHEGGLASHGAAFGILFALWIYSRYHITFKNWKLRSQRITRPGQNYLQVVDRIVIVVALTGCLIRFGNFMNSEIYGKPTYSEYGVIFAKNAIEFLESPEMLIEEADFRKDATRTPTPEGYQPIALEITFINNAINSESYITEDFAGYLERRFRNESYFNEHIYLPTGEPMAFEVIQKGGKYVGVADLYGVARHPTQLYEAFTSLMIFFLLFIIWWRMKNDTPAGLLLGLFLILLFGLRFIHELFKENQVSFEDGMQFNMGQLLSIPLIAAGIIILVRALTSSKNRSA